MTVTFEPEVDSVTLGSSQVTQPNSDYLDNGTDERTHTHQIACSNWTTKMASAGSKTLLSASCHPENGP